MGARRGTRAETGNLLNPSNAGYPLLVVEKSESILHSSPIPDPFRHFSSVPLKRDCVLEQRPRVLPGVSLKVGVERSALGQHDWEAGTDGVVQSVDGWLVADGN
jgi:hypothetical protein